MLAPPDIYTSAAPEQTVTGNTAVDESADTVESVQESAEVKRWLTRISCAKKKWEPDFKRMRQNMEFVWGLQWDGQTKLDDDRYNAFIALRIIQQKVSTLYAKNPVAVATPRKRLYYQVWDESLDTLMQTMQQAQEFVAMGIPVPLEQMAMLADYQHGTAAKKLIEKFCKTFEILYGYQVDAAKPEFKAQMKQAVRRGVICGVAYARPILCISGQESGQPNTTETKSGSEDLTNRLRALVTRIDDEGLSEDSPDFQNLRSLMMSLGASTQLQDDSQWSERLEFDFPPATSVIPDERCRNLEDFVAARWIAQEYILPVEEVNEIFGVQVEVGTGMGCAKEFEYSQNGLVEAEREGDTKTDPQSKKKVCLYEVFDKTNKTRFFLVDGWKKYVLAPEYVTPAVAGFWQHFALVFNNTEIEDGLQASMFPPSDVQTLLSPAREWNRTREALRDHRNANAPRYMWRAGTSTVEEMQKLANAEPNSMTELKNVDPTMPLDKVVMGFPVIPITEALYAVEPLEQDLMLGANMQQANVGPAQPNVTATVGSIAEQSRMNVSSSNVDDLDGFLSRLAQAAGEMMLQTFSQETVRGIVGTGAIWPGSPEERKDFLNEVFMQIQAASSGRPNKAVDIQNYSQLAPLLTAAGANPLSMIEEGVKRLDDNLDVAKFFPVPQMGMGGEGQPQQPGQEQQEPPPGQAGPPVASNGPAQGVASQPASMVG
jgi:hypothetical protein